MGTPTKGRADYYKPGDYNIACSMCGRKRKASEVVRNWQGLYRCPEHNEPRQPQDFARGIKDVMTVPFAQPEADTFVTQCTFNDRSAIPGYALPGCSIPGNSSYIPGIGIYTPYNMWELGTPGVHINAGGATLNLQITADAISASAATPGLTLSSLMSGSQQTAWLAGNYQTLNISAGGAPGRGYWVISGYYNSVNVAVAPAPGFLVDILPVAPVTIYINSSQLRFYGGGGTGGSSGSIGVRGGYPGGDAFRINPSPLQGTCVLNIDNSISSTGRFYGGGGGGSGSGTGSAGGGAAGWTPGLAGGGVGGSTAGGIYDTANGGSGNPGVAGGVAGGTGAGAGGGLGAAGSGPGSPPPGAAGAAVSRTVSGTTTFLSGSGSAYVLGTVS